MQYEDSEGYLWTEEQDDDGYVYFVNANTMETAWELPPSAREVEAPYAADESASSALVPLQDASTSWTEVFDESTNSTYYFNTLTQESSWDLGTDERVASGIYHPPGGDDDAPIDLYSSSHNLEGESSISSSWRDEVLAGFQVPQEVSEAVGRAGSAHVWPRTVDGRPSRLERWDVLKASDPYREHFSTGETWRLEHPEFEPKLCFYAFDTAVEHVERYWVEEAEAPFRCRLQRDGLKFSRDIAKWEARAPARQNANANANANANGGGGTPGQELDGNEHWGGDGGGGGESGGGDDSEGGSGGGDGAGFFAFPLVVHNSHSHHVDWTSGPDRYQITQDSEPEWGWTRLFTFFAYAASKYHVLETTQAPLAQKILKGNFLTAEPGWKCVLAFFAFDDMVPGSNRYYIEEKDEPHLRTRIGMEASCRWDARHSFAAFDVPVPGSCALDVHYTVRSTDSLNPYPEQCRISLKDPWGAWEQKFRFYAFPAEHVLLSPELDSDTQNILNGSQSGTVGDEPGLHG